MQNENQVKINRICRGVSCRNVRNMVHYVMFINLGKKLEGS